MPRPTRLRSLRGCAGLRFERFRSPGHQASSILTRCRTLRSMPAITGLSSCSRVLPIRPSPSARKRAAVARALPDRASDLSDPKPWQGVSSERPLLFLDGCLPRKHVAHGHAASLRDVLGAPQSAQRLLGRLQHVDRVRGAERLREHVANAAELEHGAHAAAGDDAGTGRGRAQQHPGGAEPAEHLMRDRLAVLRDGEQVLLRVLDGLRDRKRHLARLPVADADAIDLVADHDQRREREPPAALDDLGDAVDLDDALLQLSRLCDLDRH